MLLDDRWASAREDLVTLWLADEADIDADWDRLSSRFEGAGHVVATQADWWRGRALREGRGVHASLFARIAAGAENPAPAATPTRSPSSPVRRRAPSPQPPWSPGCSTAVRPSSPPPRAWTTIGWRSAESLYRDHARFGASLWVIPANMASYADIDALISWGATSSPKTFGPQSIHIKDALNPTLLFLFTPLRWPVTSRGRRPPEMEMKVLLWAVRAARRRLRSHRRRA